MPRTCPRTRARIDSRDMIRFSNVFKRYADGGDALRGVSFSIEQGEFAFLTGHSGAGKSTLLKLVTLVERASRGSIEVAGQDLEGLGRSDIPAFRRRIGVVYQDHKLLADRSVFENVALPLMVSGMAPADTVRRVRAALQTVGLLERESVYPTSLSGGEQQRVGIARAIVNRPEILLADEPTGNLDPDLADEIMNLFRRFNQHNITVLVATHDPRHYGVDGVRVLELGNGLLMRDGIVRTESA